MGIRACCSPSVPKSKQTLPTQPYEHSHHNAPDHFSNHNIYTQAVTMPRIRRHRSSSKNSSDSDRSGTVVRPSPRALPSARSHRSSSTRHSTAAASSHRSSHVASASRPPSSPTSRPSTYSSSRSSMVSGTSSSRHPPSSHSSRYRSSSGRSPYTASESPSSRHSQAQSSSSGTDSDASSYDSSSESDTPPPSFRDQPSRARDRAAYVETDDPGFSPCFRPPSNDLEYYNSLGRARGHQREKRDYVAELSEQFINAPTDRLEFILDKLTTQLADLVRLDLYITSLERYHKRNDRKDIWGEMSRILARYERAMNTPQLFQAMGDITFE